MPQVLHSAVRTSGSALRLGACAAPHCLVRCARPPAPAPTGPAGWETTTGHGCQTLSKLLEHNQSREPVSPHKEQQASCKLCTKSTGRGLPMRRAVWATADLPTPCLMEGRESWFEQGSNGCASCTAGVRPAVYCGRLHRGEVCCCSGVLCRLDDVGANLLYAGSVRHLRWLTDTSSLSAGMEWDCLPTPACRFVHDARLAMMLAVAHQSMPSCGCQEQLQSYANQVDFVCSCASG